MNKRIALVVTLLAGLTGAGPVRDLPAAGDKPGVYPYICGPHPQMTGEVVVE